MTERRIEIDYDYDRSEYRIRAFRDDELEHEYWNPNRQQMLEEFFDDNPDYRSSTTPADLFDVPWSIERAGSLRRPSAPAGQELSRDWRVI